MARTITLVIFIVVLLVGLEIHVSAAQGPSPAPEPGTPQSKPSVIPKAEPEPSSEPEAGPTSEPSAEPGPETSAEPETGPEPEPTSEPEGEPSPNPEAEVTSEPEATPESGAEPEPKPEPDGEPEPEPENNNGSGSGSPFAEPVPAWDVALPMFDWAWPFHIYVLGVLFALLALYSLGAIIRLRQRRLLSYGYFITLNLLMLLIGVIRAVYLLVDAYNYKGIWPDVVAYLLLGTGFPCLTSAFSILFLALLQSTKTRLVPPTIQKPKFLAIVVIGHFAFSFTADVVVGLNASAAALLLACQATFVIWGLFLVVSYLVIFRRLHRSSQRKFREFNRLSKRTASVVLPGERPIAFKPKNNWGSAIRLTLVTAVLGFLIVLLQLYGMLVVYGPVGGQKAIPDPWPWWSYQFIFRVLEFLMCALMSATATQPFRYDKDGKEKPHPCAPCWNSLCVACGRRQELDFTQDEELNSKVWSSAFEPCLPQKPSMYPGLAESANQDTSNVCLINMNGNNSAAIVDASVNVHSEESANADKLKDLDLKIDLGLMQDSPGMRKSKSTELIASGDEMNNRTRAPQTAPPGGLGRAPFTENLPEPGQGQVVKNQLESPKRQSDKDINCQSSGDMPASQEKPEMVAEVEGMKPEREVGSDHGQSEGQSDLLCGSPKGDISLDVTEMTPLNPEH